MIVGCGFGGRVKSGELTAFERKYFQHQADFAHEELGDQVDDKLNYLKLMVLQKELWLDMTLLQD